MKHEVHNPYILTPEQNSVNGFTLGEGQQWRKTRDPWAWDELPPTFRPFTTLDIITVGDQFQYHGMTGWLTIAEKDSDVGAEPYTSHKFRTRRPLPTPEIPWTEWHGGKCPLKDEEVEEWAYMARDGFTCSSPSAPSCYTPYWEHNAGADDIITYRVLKWKEKPYAAPPVKSPEVHELQERFTEPQLTYHQWRGEPLPPVETFPAAMEAVTKQESPPTDNDTWNSLLESRAKLERELRESRAREAQLKDALADRAIEIAGDQALVNLLSETREAFYESLRREAQLRAALDAPPHDQQHVKCVCYGKNPAQVQVGYICNKCRALTLPAPPVVPVEDVKPLVDVITYALANHSADGEGSLDRLESALSTFTAKHKI